MNRSRFDDSLRALATSGSRRRALRLLAGGLVAGLLARRTTEPVSAAQLDGTNGWALCGENQLTDLWANAYHCGSCNHSCWENPEGERGEVIIPYCDHGVCKQLHVAA